ncbi:MAG: type I DNA topoisomerase [Bacillota bacterium]
MSKVLVIVESPAKAKTISKFLGSKYTVKSSMGHIRDLPKSQLGVDVDNGFEPKYITIRGKGDIVKELRSEAKKCKKVLLAADPDREGEAIAWHLQQILGIDDEEQCRIEFNEITKKAVQEALKKPRQIDGCRVSAQQARRVLDRLVGYKLSPLLWSKIRKGLSAGRVQSVAVRLICDREAEIKAFVPEEYWSLTALLATENEEKFSAKLAKIPDGENAKISSQAEMEKVLQGLEKVLYRVEKVQKRDKKRSPSPPFTTSSLQQEAYRKLNFTAKKTMRLAQELYEGLSLGKKEGAQGLITYIRTDSTRVASQAQEEARRYIAEKYGAEYVPDKPNQYVSKKNAQGAHEAIRPTSPARDPESLKNYLSRDQLRLYQLIWERFLASQMSPALLEVTTLEIAAGTYQFRASGSVVKFPGFLRVYTVQEEETAEESDHVLPPVAEGELLKLIKLEPKQHFTQPPPRYSEATLVKTLEELGIGRPSTYAPTIDNILNRGYVVREQKQFVPTELGQIVVDLLKEYFSDIIDVQFTAHMEQKLDEIEEGELEWRGVVEEFYLPFAKLLAQAEKEIGEIVLEDEETDHECEKCGRKMVIKTGRYGKFLACPGFPDCRNTKPLLETIGVPCPFCKGEVVIRKSKRGKKFYGCSNYPYCDYLSWDKPTTQKCPDCGKILVEKQGKQKGKLVCGDKSCGYETQISDR